VRRSQGWIQAELPDELAKERKGERERGRQGEKEKGEKERGRERERQKREIKIRGEGEREG
jgi:hypothetical protein